MGQVLEEQENRNNFLSRKKDFDGDSLIDLFAHNDLLEAVLITEHGERDEDLKAIATRWDVAHFRKRLQE